MPSREKLYVVLAHSSETVEWIKRLRDMCRLAESRAPRLFLPPKPHDFVGRAEALEELYSVLVEEQDSALLHGEPDGI